ncbi:hypothetical protein DMC30DRAFT_348856 [Rhodotorula diobovata]|uniref:Translational machinery component n=1 Tax=Rhodotorula diobovata TaxID=5288 RepID=A0A5C5G1R8_9BASI|nr:hypothetical protein DMC30DRAFT_348856 [Rhodotorula diobovata]
MSLFASGSRTLYRAAAAPLRTRPFATAPTTTTSPVEQEQSSPAPAPTPTPTPLPGSAVLPEAFRAQATSSAPSPAAPATRSSRSPAPTPAAFQAGTFLQQSNARARAHRLTQPYKLHVYSTRNNTILTLSTAPTTSTASSSEGAAALQHPVAWVSAGNAGYKGAARGTYDAAVEVALRMFRKIQDLAAGPPPTELEVVWKGFGQGRDAVFRTLMGAEGDGVRGLVRRVTDATPLKVGGTRPKKRRVCVVVLPFSFPPRAPSRPCPDPLPSLLAASEEACFVGGAVVVFVSAREHVRDLTSR